MNSYNELTSVFESCGVPIIVIDMELKVKWTTPAIRGIFGRIPEIGQSAEEFHSTILVLSLVGEIKLSLEVLSQHIQEFVLEDGRWLRADFRLMNKDSGIVASFSDITDVKKATAHHYPSFPITNPYPLLETDASGEITFHNPATAKILNEMGLGLDSVHIFLPEDFEDILRHWDQETDMVHYREVHLRDRIFAQTLVLVPQVKNVRIFLMDITARIRDQHALSQAEKEWERTFDCIPDLVAILDDQNRVVRMNKAFSDRVRDEHTPSKNQLLLFDKFDEVRLDTTEVPLKEVDLLEVCSNSDYLVTTTPLTDEFDEPRGCVFVARNVSQLRRTENALRKAEERVRRKLEAVITPRGDIGELDFADVIDVQTLQAVMSKFYRLTNTPIGLIDLKGNIIVGIGWQEVCVNFHRVHPESCKNCIESDINLSTGVPQGQYKMYKCKNNMWDVATPIVVGGTHLANIFLGQFFLEDEVPDYDLFRAQARHFGFDEEEYLSAVQKVPRVTRTYVHDVMAYYMELAGNISTLSYRNVYLARLALERSRLTVSLEKQAQRLNLLADASSCLLGSKNLHQAVEMLCHNVGTYLNCHVFLSILSNEQNQLLINSYCGVSADEARALQILCCPRDQKEAGTTSTALIGFGIQTHLCHFLTTQHHVVGALFFGRKAKKRFSDDDLALVKSIGDQILMAVERKVAEDELRKTHDELEERIVARTEELASTVQLLNAEINERQTAQERTYRLNSLYTILSQANKAVVKTVDRQSLFNDICRIIVECGNFRLAWIGLVDPESGQVEPVASAGASEYLADITVTTTDEPNGRGPTGRAVRDGTYCICNDFESDPLTQPWHAKGRLYGIKSSASIAIIEGTRVIGALTIYSGQKEFFDVQQVELLQQLASDTSFALENLEKEANRRKTERALQEEILQRLRVVEELREKEQLLIQQGRFAAMGEMMSNIAHQWRQPLNVLALLIQDVTLREQFGELDREYLDKNSNKAMEVIQHMSRTIDDFRDFFKPNKEKVLFCPVNAIRAAISLVDASLTAQGIRVSFEANIAGESLILGYPNEYSQAILNVLINARDILIDRKIQSPEIRIEVTKRAEKILVTITDTAGGIPDEIIGKIFDPYFTTKGPLGTGIGLFMAKNIIENNMAGRLYAANVESGAQFTVET